MNETHDIYVILNKITGFRYIGSSKSIGARKSSHFAKLGNGKHENHLLQTAYNKDGKDSLEWGILESDLIGDDVEDRESYWVEFYAPSGVYNVRNPKNGKKDVNPTRPDSKNNLRRIYLSEDEYNRVFQAAVKKGFFLLDTSANEAIAAYLLDTARKIIAEHQRKIGIKANEDLKQESGE